MIAAHRLSLVVASGGYSLVAVHGLLLVVDSLVAEDGFLWTRGLSTCGTWAYLPCGMWNLSGPGIKSVSPALEGEFFTTVPPGKSSYDF